MTHYRDRLDAGEFAPKKRAEEEKAKAKTQSAPTAAEAGEAAAPQTAKRKGKG